MECLSRFCYCVFVFIVLLMAGCRHKRNVTDQYPFRRGCYSIAWGIPAAALDTLVRKDSSWSRISWVLNSRTDGKIVVVRRKGRDYYLEFTERDKLFSMNYISERGDLDSVSAMILRYYGEPDKSERVNGNFENKIWQVEGDSVSLEIQLLITRNDYSLKVLNKNISN